MWRNTVLTLLACSCLSVALMAQETQDKRRPVPPVPTTISGEAQDFLRTPTVMEERAFIPQTPEEWQSLQSKAEKEGNERSKKVIQALAKSVEVRQLGGIDVHVITPKTYNAANADKAIMHIHGGGFCLHTPESTYAECAPLADLTGLKVYSIDYRLAPQHPFPAGVDDCVAAYRGILEEVSPERLGVSGLSAGANLVLTMTLKARDKGLPMPGALACITPVTDLNATGDSCETNDGLDPVLGKRDFFCARAYAGNADKDDPLLSPIFAEFSQKFPPTIIQTGTRDLLLSDCVRLHQKMKEAGVDVELSVREGMWHAYHVIPNCDFPEARAGCRELADFFRRKLRL